MKPIGVAVLTLLLIPAATAAQLRLIPEPRSIQLGEGRLALRAPVTIAVASGEADDRFAAELLEQEIEAIGGVEARVVAGREGAIVLARDPDLADAGDEGYQLEVGARGARVIARTAAGVFYGVQTLRQMVEPGGIPVATITDRPALRWRGVHDDVTRGPVPTLDALKRRVRTLAEFKVNLYALYMEHVFDSPSQPLMTPAGGAITAAEIRELVDHARRHHVAVMLEQQTFGHMGRLLALETYRPLAEVPGAGSLSPARPESYAFAESLYREIAPLGSAPFVHVGGDEMAELGRGQSKALVERQGAARVYVDHLRRLRELIAAHGKRPMVWGDALLAHPERLADLPRDLVVATWEYQPHDDYARWITPFQRAKLDFLVSPGVSNWNRIFPNLDMALPNIRGFTLAGQRAGALGQLACTWDDNGDALFGLAWYPVLFAAAAAWQQGDSDPARFRRSFDWAFLRSPGEEAAAAVEKINGAHALLGRHRPTDATLELGWLNPVQSSLDQRLLLMIEPSAAELRRSQEDALVLLARARRGARRNADQLDYLGLAARRLHAIGTRALFARRIQELYRDALASQSPKERASQAVESIKQILGLMAQGREQTAELRTEYERLWLAENRPYWLPNVLAQFDHDLWVWVHQGEELRIATVQFRNGRPLPAAEQLGIAP
jgi:hexosaminidase